MTNEELQAKVMELDRMVRDLERWKSEQEIRNTIDVDGAFDGTNIPVRVNGIRRKIATTTP